ncbi:MAG: cytochrome c-type biosis protein [Acidimicrobiaceae bacterium]
MIDAPFALAFTTGMVVTVNPCGFAMLPAYLSFFVGVDQRDSDARTSVARALVVGITVTAGFVLTFTLLGLIVKLLTDTVYNAASWMSIVVGLALVVFGVALLAGYEPNLRLPHLERGGRTRGLGSMFVFGVSYAVASLGCSLPVFLAYTYSQFQTGIATGIATSLAFTAGFGLVLVSLTIALALAKQSLVHQLRRVLPYVNRIAGALLVLTGAYVAYYGTVEIRGAQTAGAPVDKVTSWSATWSNWFNENYALVGLLGGIAVAAAIAFVATARRRPADR